MIKIIIWGMGKTEKLFRRYLNSEKAVVVAYTSSDAVEGTYEGVKVISAKNIGDIDYDFVIVASFCYGEIEKKLVELGISEQRVRQVYDREKYKDDDVIKNMTYWNFTCTNHEYEIGKYRIDLGCDHQLPKYQREFPMYDCFLGELSKQLNDDEWAIDIGANVGDSVFLLRKHSDVQILAIEPVLQYYCLLCKNTRQIKNVFPRQYLISLCEGQYNLVEHDGTAYAKEVCHSSSGDIRSITFNHLLKLEQIELEKIRLIKIDTDGFDAECIMSLKTALKKIKAYIYFENYFDSKETYSKFNDAYNFLLENGYEYFFVFDNFGNYLCEGNVKLVKEINEYLLRGKKGDSADAIGYVDILAVPTMLYGKAQKIVRDYVDIFNGEKY